MTSNSFHQQSAKQTSLVVLTSDVIVVCYLGPCNKYHRVHGSFSGSPGDLHMGHTRLKRIVGLENLLKPTTFQLNGFFYNKGYNTGNLEVNCQVLQMCVQLYCVH